MFYDNFVRLCNSVGKKPSAVAIEIGISKSLVSRWKSGGGVTDANLQKIADYFGVTVDYILRDTDDPRPAGQKEEPPAQGGELSEKDVRLIAWFRSLPPEKQKAILISQDAPKDLLD